MTRDAPEQPDREALAEAAELLPQPGAIFDGKYRIERTLGRGAMAVVLEATHLQLQDRVAIKLLLPRWTAQPELVERFMREGRAATRIRSEHVVRVFDVGVADAQPYLVMEYLDGSDLDQVLDHDGPLPVPLAIDYLLQACEAIAEAHAHGIVHRDLKPANLFLTRRADGSACVKVLDFGISKAAPSGTPDPRTTEPAAVMGSPHYMSPEQMLSSTDVDARSDLWALGAILHELLVAAPAFNGDTIAALSASVLRDPPPPLTSLRADVPPAVEAVVLRCLEKEASRRFANVAELANTLADHGSASARASAERIARVLDSEIGKASVRVAFPPVQAPALAALEPSAPPPSAPPPPRMQSAASFLEAAGPPSRRPPGRMFGYVVAAIAFIGIATGITWMVVRDERALRAADEPQAADAATSPSAVASNGAAGVTTTNADVGRAPAPAPLASAPETDATHAPPAPRTPPTARPSTHARGPRRGPGPPRKVPPLPDFPVPGVDPQGEPPSRPILVPTPGPAGSATPAPPPLPPGVPPKGDARDPAAP